MIRYRGHIYRRANPYHATHRRAQPNLREGHIFFLEHAPGKVARNSHYGPYVWVLQSKLPPVPDTVVEFAADYYNTDDAYELVNPPDIVADAGAWEDNQFVYEVWDQFGEPVGFSTPDGAVMLDWREANVLGPLTEDQYYERFGV